MGLDPAVPQPAEEARRRTDRVLGPVPIRIIGMDANGTAFTEDAVTVSFNQQGARISMVHSLLIDDIILVLNKRSGIEEEFRVVGAFEEVIGGRREWGVEASVQDGKIWGVEFSAPSEQLQPKALIECGGCKRVVQSEMSSIEYDVLLAIGMISRHCTKCSETTRWKPSASTSLPEIEHKLPPGTQSGERRRAKRIRLAMRIRVRNSWGTIDIAQTRDVSKTGVCFFTTKVFNKGDEVYLVLPFAANSVPVETKGTVVWVETAKEGRYCGVKYIR
jgi:PilZ domain